MSKINKIMYQLRFRCKYHIVKGIRSMVSSDMDKGTLNPLNYGHTKWKIEKI